MGRYRLSKGIAVLAACLWAGASSSAWAQPLAARKLTQFKLSIQGLQATLDPAAPVVPKGIASAVRIRIQAGDRDLSLADAATLLGSGLSIHAELAGPSLNQTVTLPIENPGAPKLDDPLLLPLPALTIAGDYALTNIRLVRNGRAVLDVNPRSATLRVIDQILVTSVKTRALTLDEIKQKQIALSGNDYIGYEFSLGLKLDSKVVNLTFPAVFDRNGVSVPVPTFDPSDPVARQDIEIPGTGGGRVTWVPMLLEAEGPDGAKDIGLTMPNGEPIRIPSVLVIPGNVGFLKQFFSAQLYVANGAPGGSGLSVQSVSGTMHLPVGDDLVAGPNPSTGKNDDPLALPTLHRDGKIIEQPTTMPVRGPGPDGVPGTDDDVDRFEPGAQGQAEFLLRGEREGFHRITFDVAATLHGLPVGPVKVTGKGSGGVLVRNARFEMNFTVPTVVRRLERFKVYTTLTNVGQGNANDVTVALDTLRMANVKPVGATSIHIDTIEAGGAKTIAFEFESQRTGAVTAAYLRFDPDAETDAKGKMNFTVGVSEQGVALSPDTLALPATLEQLPTGLVDSAMHVLGLAWSNAHARSLPSGTIRISREVVIKKALALAEVDLRHRLGQALPDGLRDLGFDFYGGTPVDPGFDQLLRTSRAGQNFAAALGAALDDTAAGGLLAYERELAEIAASGPDFVSFAIDGGAPVGITVTDDLSRKLTNTGTAEIKPAEIDGGVLVPMGPGQALGLITRVTSSTYRIALGAGADWSATFPRGNGHFSRVSGSNVQPAVITLDVTHPDTASVTEDVPGGEPETRPLTVEVLDAAGPRLLTAHVIGPEILPAANPFGFSAAFLFDRIVNETSAADASHYAIPMNPLVGARRQLSGRLVLATLSQPEGPYVPTTLGVTNIADSHGIVGPGLTVPLKSLLEGAGGVVTGRVLQADATPVRSGEVFYHNIPPNCGDGMPRLPVLLAAAPLNGEGWYELRYVRRHECGMPFTLKAQDPQTTAVREVQGFVRGAGERLQIDLALVGQGSVTGVVRDLAGSPVAGAAVLVTSLVDEGLGRNGTTDAAGVYLIHGLTVGAVEVRAAKGIGLGRNSGVIERSGTTKKLDITLDAGTVKVSGTFLHVEDGVTSPVPGVVVVYAVGGVGGKATGYAWTKADGTYVIDGMPVGPFTVSGRGVSRSGQAFANDTITGFDLVEEVTPENTPVYGVVRGKVVLPANLGSPGRVVVATDITDLGSVNGVSNFTYTDAEGNFALGGIKVGVETTIQAVTLDRSRTGSARVFVDPISKEATGVVIELSGLGTAVFKVLGPNNLPLANQEVRIIRDITNWGSCKNPCGCTAISTNGQGLVRFDRMPIGSVSVKAIRTIEGVTDVVNGSLSVTAEGQTVFGELKFAGVGTVTGTIESPDEHTTIAGGDLRLTSLAFENDGQFVCDLVSKTWYHGSIPLNNQYTITRVNVGPVSVTATNPFTDQRVSASANLRAHGDTLTMPTLRWTNTMGGELSGVVLLSDGVTPAGAGVEVRADGPLPDVTVWTNEEGRFAYAKVLPRGSYTLTVRDPLTGGLARDSVYLPLGKDAVHTVRLKGRGTVRVKVSEPSGAPTESALVALQEIDFPNRKFDAVINKGDNGQTQFEGIFEGRVSVQVRDGFQRGGAGSGNVDAPDASIEIPVTLSQTGTVKGRFFMPDRTPVPFAAVRLLLNGQAVGQQTTTSTEPVGSFQFDYVPLGQVRVELRDPLTGRTGAGSGALTQDGQQLYLDVTAQSIGIVEGHVWQSHAGAAPARVPTAEVNVTVGPAHARIFDITTFADGAGHYLVEGVPEGVVTATATLRSVGHARLFPGSSTDTREGEGGTLVLDVTMQDTGIVTGEVQTVTGAPLQATANVALSVAGPTSWYQTAPTSPVGGIPAFFHFDRVPTGNATAIADVLNSNDKGTSAPFVVPSGTVHVPIRLNGLGYLRLFVQDAAGNPASGSVVVDIGTGTFSNHFSRPVSGQADFPDVFAGPVKVSLQGKPGDFSLYGMEVGEVTSGSTAAAPSVVTVKLEPAGTVRGIVKHADGTFAKGAEVSLTPLQPARPLARTYVSETGAFTFTGVPFGAFKLTVQEPITQGRILPVLSALEGTLVDVGTLTLDATPPQILVVEPATGSSRAALAAPIKIDVSDAGSGVDNGSLRVTYAVGHVQSIPVVDGHATATLQAQSLVVGPNRITVRVSDKVGLTADVPVDFVVTGGTVRGQVTRGEAGTPVAHAAVQINNEYRLTADDAGRYEQAGLRPGQYTVTATDPESNLVVTATGTLADGGGLVLNPVLPDFGTITGVVRDAADLQYVDGVTVTTSGRSAITKNGGQFDLGAFRAGTYTLEATAPDGDRGRRTVEVTGSTPVPASKIVLNGIGTVTVTVTRGGNPVSGAHVSFKSSAPFTNDYAGTTQDGRVTFTGVLAGTFTVKATYQDLVGTSSPVTLASRGDINVAVPLSDVTPPKVVAVTPANNAIEVGLKDVVRVVFDEPLSVAPSITVRLGGVDVPGAVVLGPADTATFTHEATDLQPDAIYSVGVTGAKDLEGNTQTLPYAGTFKTKDTVAPTLTWAAPTLINPAPPIEGWISAARPTFRISLSDLGSGLDLSTVVLTVDGQAVVPMSSFGQLQYTPPEALAEGEHVVAASVKDRAGNLGQLTRRLGVDTIAPGAATLSGVTDGQIIRGVTSPLSGTATDDGSGLLRIDVYADANTSPSVNLPAPSFSAPLNTHTLAEGGHVLTAKAVDRAGNVGPVSTGIAVTVDNVQLSVTLELPTPEKAVRESVAVRARVTEPVKRVELTFPNHAPIVLTASSTAQRVFEGTFALTAADQGRQPIGALAAGLLDEVATATPVHVVVDWAPPALPDATKIHAEVTDGGMALVLGQPGAVEGNAFVEVVNTSRAGQAQNKAAGDGLFVATLPGLLHDMLTVTVIDSVGNRSEPIVVEVREPSRRGPVPLAGMKIWLEAGLGITKNAAGRVSSWEDQREGTTDDPKNNAVQVTAAAQPLWSSSDGNGLPSVFFDGNDAVVFSRRITNIRTVFWVVKESSNATSDYRPLLGDGGNDTWRGGAGAPGSIWLNNGCCVAAALLNGQTGVNGRPVVGTQEPRPRTMSVVSLVTTANVSADRFGRDWNYGWWGDLAELIIYDRPLSASDRKTVEEYLITKYRPAGATKVSTPRASPNGGVFTGAVGVTLSAVTPLATIRYTLDGSEPTEVSTAYVEGEPFTITETTTLKAKAFRSGYEASDVATVTFTSAQDTSPKSFPDLKLWWRADAGVPTGFGEFWEDQSGNNNHGGQTSSSAIPRLAPGSNNLPTMSFDGDDQVIFTTRITGIRTVFWVVKESTAATSDYRPLLGDGGNDTWRGGAGAPGSIWMNNGCCVAASVLNGQTWMNGRPVLGNFQARPRKHAVVSLVTTGPVNADRFGRDYNFWWWGDLSELVIYNRALSPSERKAIEDYLIAKYKVEVTAGELTPVSAPLITPSGGVFSGSATVSLSATTPNATIWYTLDGTEPAVGAIRYQGPFTISDTATIRAKAFRDGFAPSAETAVTFHAQSEAMPSEVTRTAGGTLDGSLKLWWRADAGVPTGFGDFWVDQSGNNNHGGQTSSAAIPRLVPGSNDLPAMSFDGDDQVIFPARLTGIRTVFWVVKESSAATSDYRPLLGDGGNDTWRGGVGAPGSIWLNNGCCVAAAVLNGPTWVNGRPVTGTFEPRPRKHAVISLVTTGPVNADRFGRDYNFWWWGDLSELVIYDRALSASERKAVEDYLIAKYKVEVTAGELTPVSAPLITPSGGVFSGSTTVSLSTTTPKTTIWYTLDGTEPAVGKLLYQGPFTLSATRTIRARAFREGFSSSRETTVTLYSQSEATPFEVTRTTGGTLDGSLKLWWRADAGVPSGFGDFWADQSGNNNHGLQNNSSAIPRLVPGLNNLPAMSFDGSDQVVFTTRITGIRTVFWVVKESTAATSDYRPLLGDGGNDTWRGGIGAPGSIWLNNGCCVAAAVLNGQTRVNGQLVVATQAQRPRSLSVVSLVTPGAVSADRFGRDYNFWWWGDLAELILYDRALTNDERAAVETFLKSKYGIQ